MYLYRCLLALNFIAYNIRYRIIVDQCVQSYSVAHFVFFSCKQLIMIEERRWPMGNKYTELHGGFGTISTIKWKENLIAWANEKVYLFLDPTYDEYCNLIGQK